jgi:hypothetical protein
MAGNSNCRWYWGTKEGSPEPTIPWCGLLWSDGTPVSLAEAEAVRHYVTGESKALFFDNFQPYRLLSTVSDKYLQLGDFPANVNHAKWTFYRQPTTTSIGQVCQLPSNSKMIVRETALNDYILESVVMLDNDQSEGNAGLIFRVNNPKGGVDDFTGYYAGFDLNTLYLGKFVDGKWNQLATYPLQKLDCKILPNVWNQIRVEVQGSQIKVWFNRMHESADKENGLRIVYTDDKPITTGAIGLRTFKRNATFDNVIALPIK